MQLIDRVWRGTGAVSRAARIALTPFEAAYRAATAMRGWMYDHSILRVHSSAIPVVSVGNLSVGGTGKTPFAAWIAGELARRGAEPAVVLRGYGGDEALVHARLNPQIPVVIEPRRAEGIRRAVSLGATVAVLDDAFQHRSAERAVDIVLVSAEQWQGSPRLLPAGPWREPLVALRRASLVVITRKTARDLAVQQLSTAIQEAAPLLPHAVVRFTLGNLHNARRQAGDSLPLSTVSGRTIVAIAGIADSAAFFEQLSDVAADVRARSYPDHHSFTSGDVAQLLAGERGSQVMFVCTLKDAVKLGALWPATAPPLWYVSQALQVESGGNAINELLNELAPTSTKDS